MSIETFARELALAYEQGRSIPTFTGRDAAFDIPAAYAIAGTLHAARLARGEKPVGRKIGFTNRTIWAEYGVYEPIWGHVYDTSRIHAKDNRAELALGRLIEPRIEPEIVLHFGSAPPVTRDERVLLECIDWIAHGFEIVQSPFPNWKFGVADTVAVNGLHGVLVIGEPIPVERIADCARKLREFRISLARGGVPQDHGGGANVLDSPLLAFAHLAEVLTRLPQFTPVAAGEIVTTGTLTNAWPVAPGETWTTTLSGIELPGLTIEFR
jgi:2-keto-4-pentenoate hydratase